MVWAAARGVPHMATEKPAKYMTQRAFFWLRGQETTFTEHLSLCRLGFRAGVSIPKRARLPEHLQFEFLRSANGLPRNALSPRGRADKSLHGITRVRTVSGYCCPRPRAPIALGPT